MAGIFGIGVSGIQAAQLGMQVTQHNITNANTSGYNRQSIVQATALPVGFASGFNGNGTQVTSVTRQYNQFLVDQMRQSSTTLSSLDSYNKQIQVIDNLLADANAGVSPALQDFFKGLQQVAAAPASLPARQAMVSSAQALVSRLQGAEQRISDLYGQVNGQVTDTVALINTYGQQIARLNEQITTAESAVNQPANDLRDQRDQLISDLNKFVKVQTIPLGNSGIEVFVGKGQLLVMGNQANQMAAVRSSSDPSRIVVAIDLGSGKQELPDDLISGGELGGLLDFRRLTLDGAVNSLGKVAANLALTFNAQNANGMDLLGNSAGPGGVDAQGNSQSVPPNTAFVGNFFTIPNPKVIPSNSNSPTVTASFNAPDMTSKTNPGNYYTNITNSDYRLDYKAGIFSLTRLSDQTTWVGTLGGGVASINTQINDPTNPRGLQGITLTAPAAGFVDGDSFLIQPTREMARNITVDARIAGDVRLIASALPVRASVGMTNQGSMQVTVDRVRQDATAGTLLGFPVQIRMDANGMSLLGAGSYSVTVYPKDGSAPSGPYTLAPPPAVAGNAPPISAGDSYEITDGQRRVQFSFTGNPQLGVDTFTLSSNGGGGAAIGVSDSSNIILLGKLQTQNTSDGGTATYQGIYAQMVSDIGNKAREIEVTKGAQQSLVDQANEANNAESGVNLDEEAANLLKFQQLYQASARSISVGQKIFDELLSIARG